MEDSLFLGLYDIYMKIAIIIIVLVVLIAASFTGGVLSLFKDDEVKDDEVKDCMFTELWGVCAPLGGSAPTCGAGEGVQTNSYIITRRPNEFGNACPVGGTTRSCDLPECPQNEDCTFTEQWGVCAPRGGSAPTCGAGEGVQTNSYIISRYPTEFGNACPVGGTTRSCDLPECPQNVIGVTCTGYYALDDACTNALIQHPELCGSQYHSGEVPFTVRTEGDICPERNLTRSKTCPVVACPAETETETETETDLDLDCQGIYDIQSYCNDMRELYGENMKCHLEYDAGQVPFTVTREALPGGYCPKRYTWSVGTCPAVC